MPYSNRPNYGEPQPLSSDYQQQVVGQYYPSSIPRAPRAASFPEPSARGHQYNETGPFRPQSYNTGGYAAHNSARGQVPSAPNSLSPVAMASARNAVATGPQQTMDAGPSRPSAKAGMSILFAGAIIGGLIGAVMHAREKAEIAFASRDVTHETVVAPNGGDKPPVVVNPAGSGGGVIVAPEKVADSKTDKKDADKADKKKGGKRVAWVGTKKTTTTSMETETVASAEETPAPTKGKTAKKTKDDDDGYTVASADGSGKSAEPTPTKKVEKVTEAKPEKAEPKKAEKEAKAEKPEPKKAGKNDDAVKLLKEAMGVTENSL